MRRTLSFLAALLVAWAISLPGRAQDSPSLGDIARQAQKEKGSKQAVRTLTNDDIPSASSPSGFGGVGEPTAPGKPGTSASPSEELARIELILNKIDSMDRATLLKTVLEGVDSNFPGRNQWEQRMYAAKLVYVSRGRDLMQKAKQLQASAQNLQGSSDPNDRRVKDLTNGLKELVRDGVRADAAFQAVILEGRDLASQSFPH